MQTPPAAIIEVAADQMKDISLDQLTKQAEELKVATGKDTLDFMTGYNLGIQTSRVMNQQNTLLQLRGINPHDLL